MGGCVGGEGKVGGWGGWGGGGDHRGFTALCKSARFLSVHNGNSLITRRPPHSEKRKLLCTGV